jgi:predicted signal transduction protein with EAL and GGDEF domain
VLTEIRKQGVQVAVDDFGVGYCNLRHISDLTPDIVELDRELVAGIKEGARLYDGVVTPDLCIAGRAAATTGGLSAAICYAIENPSWAMPWI